MPLATLPHPRLLPLILALLFIIFALSSLFSLFTSSSSPSILNFVPTALVRGERTPTGYSATGSKGNTISIQNVLDAGARHVAESSRLFDAIGAKRDLGIDLGGNWTLQSYADYLENTWQEFLGPQGSNNADHPTLQTALSYTSLLPREQETEMAIPNLIYTTDLLEPQQLPEQFQSWITQNPDWTTMFVGDEEIDTWLENSLGATGIKKSRAQEELLALKEDYGVVRADLFRWVAAPFPGEKLSVKDDWLISLSAIPAGTLYSCSTVASTPIQIQPVSFPSPSGPVIPPSLRSIRSLQPSRN